MEQPLEQDHRALIGSCNKAGAPNTRLVGLQTPEEQQEPAARRSASAPARASIYSLEVNSIPNRLLLRSFGDPFDIEDSFSALLFERSLTASMQKLGFLAERIIGGFATFGA
jgi:hypothetical protein